MTFAIILAAGSGTRLNQPTPKQYLNINNRSLLERVLTTFDHHPAIDQLIIVISQNDQFLFNQLKLNLKKPHHLVYGGYSRQQSVFNSLAFLNHLANPDDTIMIHDSARVLIDHHLIDRGLDALKNNDGVTAIINSKDSLISISKKRLQYLNRDNICRVQTPQIFTYQAIYNAHKRAISQRTFALDDLSLLDQTTDKIGYYQGSELNFKLTDEHDFILLEALLRKEENAQ